MQVPAPFDYVRATSVGNVARAPRTARPRGPRHRRRAQPAADDEAPAGPARVADRHQRPRRARHITEDGDWLRVGALTRHADLLASEVVGRLFPIVHDAERVIADPVVRNRGTIGGSLGQADPAEDLTTVCDVLRAQVFIAGPGGERTVDIHRVPPRALRDRLRAARAAHRDPLPDPAALGQRLREGRAAGGRLGGRRCRCRASGWPRTARIADATIGLTALGLEGLATEAAGVLVGATAQRGPVRRGRRLAAAASAPIEDQRGPVDYKRHLADELTRRVLGQALDRAAHPTAVQGG